MEDKYLAYEEVIQIAKDNYLNGGDAIVECLEKSDYEYFCQEFGGYTTQSLMKAFHDRKSQLSEWESMQSW